MHKTVLLVAAVGLLTPLTQVAAQSSHAGHHPVAQGPTMLRTPLSIAAEHRGLHETLARASQETDPLGGAARELEMALAPHFKREEEIATPPSDRFRPLLAAG